MRHCVEDGDHRHNCGVGGAEEEESEGDACDVGEDVSDVVAEEFGRGVACDDAHRGVGVFVDLSSVDREIGVGGLRLRRKGSEVFIGDDDGAGGVVSLVDIGGEGVDEHLAGFDEALVVRGVEVLELGSSDGEGESCEGETEDEVETDDFEGDGPDCFFGFFLNRFFHHAGHVGDGFDPCEGETDFREVHPRVLGWIVSEVVEGDGLDSTRERGDRDDRHDRGDDEGDERDDEGELACGLCTQPVHASDEDDRGDGEG